MFTVSYEKTDVLKTWLSTSIEKRKELLTFKDSNLVSLVNCINASLVLAANQMNKNYDILESIDTYWNEPIFMQIKPSLVKGQKILILLQSKYPSFLTGKKVLYTEQANYVKLFDCEIKSWEEFQLTMCKIIEQAFLTAHYLKLEGLAEKAAKVILQVEDKRQQCKKSTKKFTEEPWLDSNNFLVEVNENDAENNDIQQMLFYDINSSSTRSHLIRGYYANIQLQWDEEIDTILNQAYYETHPFEYLQNYPIIRYYSDSPQYYMSNNGL